MNQLGIYVTVLFWVFLFSGIGLVRYQKTIGDPAGGYVCPPCGCSKHDLVLEQAGKCNSCGMPLITVKRKQIALLQSLFRNTEVPFYHHKLFYPVNFLALFIGFFALFRFKRKLPMLLFFVFFLSFVLYSFKNQLYGTPYSMHASRKWAFFPISFLLASAPALYLYISKTLGQPQGTGTAGCQNIILENGTGAGDGNAAIVPQPRFKPSNACASHRHERQGSFRSPQ